MCRVLGVSPSGYYAWRSRGRSDHWRRDEELRGTIRTIRHGAAPDRVERQFRADAPDRIWVADITYLPTWTGFVYLAIVLDVFSRKVVGWAMAHHLRTELVLAALNMAIGQRRPKEVVHHSDKGSQYTSLAFGKRCREMGVLTSTGSAGDCFDNAMAESFFATLECELIQRRAFQTQAEARTAVFQFIEGWYNTRRRHSALGYLSPNDFERVAAAAVVRRESDGGPDSKTDPEVFLIRDSNVHEHPPGLPDPSMIEKALFPPAVAHLSAAADSPKLSTETG